MTARQRQRLGAAILSTLMVLFLVGVALGSDPWWAGLLTVLLALGLAALIVWALVMVIDP